MASLQVNIVFQKSFGFDGIVSLKYPHDAVYGGGGESGQDHIVIEHLDINHLKWTY